MFGPQNCVAFNIGMFTGAKHVIQAKLKADVCHFCTIKGLPYDSHWGVKALFNVSSTSFTEYSPQSSVLK